MEFAAIQFRDPQWLLLALLPFVFQILIFLRERFRADNWADSDLLPWAILRSHRGRMKGKWRYVGVLLAWASFAVAMAGPRLPLQSWHTDYQQDPRVVAIVDVSRSMSVVDTGLSRIARARVELHDFFRQSRNLRTAITVFAARAHLLAPLSHDRMALEHYVDRLRAGMLPTEGSNLTAALALAEKVLAGDATPRAILLVSDGDYLLDAAGEAALDAQLAALRSQGIRLFVLGVGSDQAQAIPDTERGWLRYRGQAVTTARRRARLVQLAERGGGRYHDASVDNSDWHTLYHEGIARLHGLPVNDTGAGVGAQREFTIWKELYHWPLLFAAFLLLTSHLRLRMGTAAVLLPLLVVVSLASPPPARAATPMSYATGMAAWQRGDFSQAERIFASLPGYRARMGEAAALYAQGRFRNAAAGYMQAVLQARNAQERASAIFNLANSYYRLEDYAEAERLYRDVLRYRPDWAAAKINLDLALAMQARAQAVVNVGGVPRPGRGPTRARVPPGTDPGPGGLALDEEEQTGVLPPAPPAGSPPGTLQHSDAGEATAVGGIERFADPQWTYELDRPEQLPIWVERLDYDETVIWQRLFETEEGFHAPREQPVAVPGVAPW